MSGMQMAAMASSGVNAVVTLNDQFPSDIQTDPADATATYSLNSDKTVQSTNEGGIPNWLDASGDVSLYEARMTLSVGTFSGGSGAGSWLSLASSRTWFVSQTSVGGKTATATIEIRLASSGIVQDSATIILEATVDP
jgi:hypothetical protein